MGVTCRIGAPYEDRTRLLRSTVGALHQDGKWHNRFSRVEDRPQPLPTILSGSSESGDQQTSVTASDLPWTSSLVGVDACRRAVALETWNREPGSNGRFRGHNPAGYQLPSSLHSNSGDVNVRDSVKLERTAGIKPALAAWKAVASS